MHEERVHLVPELATEHEQADEQYQIAQRTDGDAMQCDCRNVPRQDRLEQTEQHRDHAQQEPDKIARAAHWLEQRGRGTLPGETGGQLGEALPTGCCDDAHQHDLGDAE